MIKYLNDLGINDIVPVLAKAYPIELDRGEIRNIKPRKLKELIKLSFDKCKDSGFHSFKKSLKEKIFYQLLEYFRSYIQILIILFRILVQIIIEINIITKEN